MLTEKFLIKVSLVLAVLFHFIFFFGLYGPFNRIFIWNFLLAWSSVLILSFIYFVTNWKSNVKDYVTILFYKSFLIIILISLLRAIYHVNGINGFFWLLFDSYTGLSFASVLFFIIGCNARYFALLNKVLAIYCFTAFVFAVIYINSFELAVFVLMPIFYVILTFPLQSSWKRLFTLVISATIIVVSLTHRAGMMRIIISYLIVVIYYVILKVRLNKNLLYLITFCILMLPFYFLYRGSTGYNVFQEILGETTEDYSEQNLRIDTRTFLYTEVLGDLQLENSLIFGKGIDGGYASEAFQTSSRQAVEVGFLQIMLKTGLVGTIIYFALLFSAIFKALGRSNSIYLKAMGILLASHALMFFIENVLAFDLLNIVIWLVIGMCHSKELLRLSDSEIRSLFIKGKIEKVQT